jgi:hypothetical protein
MSLVKPPPASEYVLLHAVNVALFLVAFGACALFVRELIVDLLDTPSTAWTAPQFTTIALLLFIWVGLTQLVVWMESPDVLVAIATFAASALLLRLRWNASPLTASALGAILGGAYLAKAAMLPIAATYLLAAIFSVRPRASFLRAIGIAAIAAAAFAIVAAPWIVALSSTKGRIDWGDAGRLNYLWFVNRSEDWPRHWPPHWPHWDGEGNHGHAWHAAPRLLERPAVYSFERPAAATGARNGFEATYPMWQDPSYWYEGLSARPNLRDQVRRLKLSANDLLQIVATNFYRKDLFNPLIALGVALAVCALASPRRRWEIHWPIVSPAVATILLYSAVYVEPRYVAAAMFVIIADLIAGLRLEPDGHSRALTRAAAIVMIAVLVFAIASAVMTECTDGWRRLLRGEPDQENVPWHVATLIHEAGIAEGEHVAIVGHAQVATRWARLARVKIVAEVPASDVAAFKASPAAAQTALDALARTSVKYVLAEDVPSGMPGWRELPGTPYSVFKLR